MSEANTKVSAFRANMAGRMPTPASMSMVKQRPVWRLVCSTWPVERRDRETAVFRLRGVGDDVHAADQGRAFVWLEHAGEHFEGGGLPGTVWALTDHRSRLSARNSCKV